MKDAKGIVVLASLLLALSLPVAANNRGVVLQGGTLLPISTPPIADGTIVIKNGKISSIGQNLAVPTDIRLIDAGGKFVMPGLIDAQSRLFVMPAELNEKRSIAPELNILDAVDPFIKDDSEVPARGVTTVCVAPGNRSLLGGKIAVLKLNGSKDVDEMLLKGEAAIKAAIGTSSNNESSSLIRLEHYSSIREAFLKARVYIRDKQKYTRRLAEYKRKRAEYNKRKDGGEDGEKTAKVKDKPKRPKRFKPDPTYEVLERVLAKEIPLQIEAHRVTDILNAIRLADEFGFSLILDKCTEGYKITEEIAKSRAPVIIGPVTTSLTSAAKLEYRNHNPRNAAILSKRGIKVALGVSGRDGISSKFILMAAALSVANGMDEDAALRAITLTPAEIVGVADRIGSLDVGKDADIVLFSGHPLDSLSQVEMVLVNGEIIFERTDQQ